jgi:N-acetylmuramoyl-L-alanine amidase
VTTSGLPLRRGDSGVPVRDLHRLLAPVGESRLAGDVFTEETEVAVRRFQESRGLLVDGICGRHTWVALVEADHRLGDRMLYLRSPMTRGEDVSELQRRLGSLGFDAGWVDGIFGPDTQRAVREFQGNVGLTDDGVVGFDTMAALERLVGRQAGQKTVAAVRELDRLRRHPSELRGRRLVVGETGGLPSVAQGLARRLGKEGAEVLLLNQPDPSIQARTANEWDGEVYVGVTLAAEDLSVAYFATSGFESAGGRALAAHCVARLTPVLQRELPTTGMRLPILRETRMPAVWCRIGPGPTVVERTAEVSAALHEAVSRWCTTPIE